MDGRGGGGEGDFDPDKIMSPKDRKRVDDFILYAIAAADEALADADWKPETDEDREATGVMVGSGIGGLGPIAETAIVLKEQGVRRVSPFFIPSALINLASGQISIRHGLKGPNHSVVTACATGAHAIGDAARMIALGDAEVMVAGGAESSIVPIGIAGFLACKALCTAYNDTPETASRPYDRGHAGFRHGRGRRGHGAGGIRARQGARGQDLRRGRGLWHEAATPITSPLRPKTARAAFGR